jgi:Flp pilus assembly protein TadD
MQQGNPTMAYYYLHRALELDPDNAQALINMSVWYHAQNRMPEARKCLQHLLQKYPENEQAKAMLQDI